ncbi:MAG: hypothetical protein HQL44_08710 [Alphaproteobacteria bacterium]|nr:hypothetical protein [Alphaproteobacteria bacterium]
MSQSSNGHSEHILFEMMKRIEPRLQELLAQNGVESPNQLSKDRARDIFLQATIEVASKFHGANIECLRHGLMSFHHDEFLPSFKRARVMVEKETSAFGLSAGIDAAIVLSGFGLPVVPLDKRTTMPLGNASNDIDEVRKIFLKYKTAYVGYSTCKAPFYFLATDCIKTLQERIKTHPALKQVHELFQRSGARFPAFNGENFRHGGMLFAREQADKISSVLLEDHSPHNGSIALYAGWEENGRPEGSSKSGYIPVPSRFLLSAITDPEFATWVWRPVGARACIH